ncbi:hypothetical protein D3C84_477420 [compost metagenome]
MAQRSTEVQHVTLFLNRVEGELGGQIDRIVAVGLTGPAAQGGLGRAEAPAPVRADQVASAAQAPLTRTKQ